MIKMFQMFRKLVLLRRWILFGHGLESFRRMTCRHEWVFSEKKQDGDVFYDERQRKCIMISQECRCSRCGKTETHRMQMYLFEKIL